MRNYTKLDVGDIFGTLEQNVRGLRNVASGQARSHKHAQYLKITVHDAVLMKVVDGAEDVARDGRCDRLGVGAEFDDLVEQLAASDTTRQSR